MLTRLGHFLVRHRKGTLAATVLALVVAAVVGGGAFERLQSGGFDDPAAESSQARDLIAERYGEETPNVLLLVTAKTGTVADPAVATEAERVTADLVGLGAEDVTSYWRLSNAPPLASTDQTRALVLGIIPGDDNEVDETVAEISSQLTQDNDVVTVAVGGYAEIYHQMSAQIENDLLRAEMIAFPITLLLLLIVFRSVIAAVLPLAVGVFAIFGAFFTLFVIAGITDVSIFAINLTTAMGLGLAIDYSLFIVSRFREELRNGADTEAAVVRTVETAGRTVAFSAFTVAIALAALLVFPLYFLRSFAYAGIAVSLIAAIGAVVSLPALLAVLGPNVDRWSIRRGSQKADGEGMWHNIAVFVMRRPWPIAIGVTALLLLLGSPFLRVVWGQADHRALPESASSRQVHEVLDSEFDSNEAGAVQVALDGAVSTPQLDSYALELSALEGVGRVEAATGIYQGGQLLIGPSVFTERFPLEATGTWVNVAPNVEPLSPEGERLVAEIRSVSAPTAALVGGQTAQFVDAKESLFDRLPIAFGWIAAATFVLLFMMFGSLLVPLKALVINVLSLTATFGALVWIFQDGNLSGALDFTATGVTELTMPILMFCVAFGLSMDYEVFLLSRIKEEHDRTGDNTASVALGLERTGRIVTAAAVLISVVFLAFSLSGVTFIKMFGLGMAIAVLMDAFVIRATLVPAFMRLAGEANWWAPAPLRRFHDRFGISEHEHPSVEPEVDVTTRDDELVGARQ